MQFPQKTAVIRLVYSLLENEIFSQMRFQNAKIRKLLTKDKVKTASTTPSLV